MKMKMIKNDEIKKTELKFFFIQIVTFCFFSMVISVSASKFNGFGMKFYTMESEHFRMNYHKGLDEPAKEIGHILEGLFDVYKNTYNINLPKKTEVLVINSGSANGWALAIQNIICIDVSDLDWNMRGTCNWFDNVVAHEYAHIVSISASFKMPAWIPYIQYGYFSHPNNIRSSSKDKDIAARLEAMHIFPSEILPPWFFEGIAQYESLRRNGDRWDTHRDMILRTLSLSDKLHSWDHMSVFTGQGDDYEKTYDHGFAMVKYIAQNYGYDKIVAILKESSRFGRINFDRALKKVLNISGRQLYKEWSQDIKRKYTAQIDSIGDQVYGEKINKLGFDNYWPRFSLDDNKVFFLSNGKDLYYRKKLYSYKLGKDVDDKKRIRVETGVVSGFYNFHPKSEIVTFSSAKSRKSTLPAKHGGIRVRDIFIDTLINEDAPKIKLMFKNFERQVSEKKSYYHSVFSPDGKFLACTKMVKDKFFLYMIDTSGKAEKLLYPPKKDPKLSIRTIHSLDWSPKGDFIAISYIDRDDRKIGLYNTKDEKFYTFLDTKHDERDPRFSRDGNSLYFSSDRTGIFNIYRYNFDTEMLQRLTNVSGGAFTPDIPEKENKLVFANYAPEGYGIYLIDSIQIVEEKKISTKNALVPRISPKQREVTTNFGLRKDYNHIPRKAMVIPTAFMEHILSEDENVFRGIPNFKKGLILFLNEPFDWLGKGSSLGCFFLSETLNPFKFFDRDQIINRSNSFDFGIFGATKKLPVDLSFFHWQRAIAGSGNFKHDMYGSDTVEVLNYNINPTSTEIRLTQSFNSAMSMNYFITLDKYKIWTEFASTYYKYIPARGYRLGTYFVFSKYKSSRYTSPRGLSFKLKYEFWDQNLIDQEKAFKVENDNGTLSLKWNYDEYKYNQITTKLNYARAVPLIKKHDIVFNLNATALKLTQKTIDNLKKQKEESSVPELQPDNLPSFYQPAEWLPGYVYYYRDTIMTYSKNSEGAIDSLGLPIDTVVVSGNGILSGSMSYRLPLHRGSIDKKLGFIYLDRLYCALNFGGAVAKNNLNDFKHLKRKDFLLWRGIELRLETISFNSFPLAISARWDYGIDRPAPIGGHKFTVKIGFSFDNWDIISEPDGSKFKPCFGF